MRKINRVLAAGALALPLGLGIAGVASAETTPATSAYASSEASVSINGRGSAEASSIASVQVSGRDDGWNNGNWNNGKWNNGNQWKYRWHNAYWGADHKWHAGYWEKYHAGQDTHH